MRWVIHPVTLGFLAFFAARILLSPFVGVTVCNDGWHSASIGKRGACSWHGGVGGLDRGSWVFPLSIVLGIGVGIAAGSFADRRVRRKEAFLAANDGVLEPRRVVSALTNASGKLIVRTRSGWPAVVRAGERPVYPIVSVHRYDAEKLALLDRLSQSGQQRELEAAWDEFDRVDLGEPGIFPTSFG